MVEISEGQYTTAIELVKKKQIKHKLHETVVRCSYVEATLNMLQNKSDY